MKWYWIIGGIVYILVFILSIEPIEYDNSNNQSNRYVRMAKAFWWPAILIYEIVVGTFQGLSIWQGRK